MTHTIQSYIKSFNNQFLSLNSETISYSGSLIVEDVLRLLSDKMGWSYKPSKSARKAAGAFFHDLLRLLSLKSNIWLYRSLHLPSFTGKFVGYKPFIRLFHGLKALGLIEVRSGFFQRDEAGGGAGEATRLRPTQDFLSLAARYGITPDNYREHFRPISMIPDAVREAVRVRAAKKGDWRKPERGKLLPINPNDPQTARIIDQVQRLNAFFSCQRYEGCTVDGLYRLFNQGDHPDFAFNKGGRLYAWGDFQRIERGKRVGIRINGDSVVEVDVAASHLTLLHSMMGTPLHLGFDPYDVPGIPRAIVKSFIVMTLGNGGFQKRWSPTIAADYAEKHGSKLQLDHPLGAARQAILAHLPALKAWPESGLSWADLQYRESLGLIATVEALAYEYGVPALPLHDAVIVPASKQELAEIVMKEAFRRHAGTIIRVTVK